MARTVIDDITEALGGDIAIGIIRNFAGRDLHIPRQLKPGHRLTKALGKADAQKLCEYMGGDYIRVPSRWGTGNRLILEARDRQIAARVEAGDNRGDIAYDNGMTVRNVHYIYTNWVRRQAAQGKKK